jgi:hypothetical protein
VFGGLGDFYASEISRGETMTTPLNHSEIVEWIELAGGPSRPYDGTVEGQKKSVIAWIDDAHMTMAAALKYVRHGKLVFSCRIPGCTQCETTRDIERLLFGECAPWPKCNNCTQFLDEMACRLGGPVLCTVCREDMEADE